MMLAMVLLSGDAGKADPYAAYVWADLAARAGQQEASLVRDYASFKLDAGETERAKQEALTCGRQGLKGCP
jgi:TPR repeat protein